MARPCSICHHPEREAIDQALVNGTAFRNISERYGMAVTSVFRHKAEHLPARMVQAAAAAEVLVADSLLDQLRDLQRRTLALLSDAEQDGAEARAVALRAVGEARRNLELLGRLMGELQEGGTTVNILVAPEWLALRGRILGALAPFPEARFRVAEVLTDAG